MRYSAHLLLAMVCVIACASSSWGADLSLKPGIAVTAEYTDNVYGSARRKESDFIIRVQPGLAMTYRAPLWDLDMRYILDYREYARNIGGELTHALQADGHARVIDGFLFLDVSDTYHRVSLDATRDNTAESLFLNQTDSNDLRISPYMEFAPAPRMKLRAGYSYRNLLYAAPSAINKVEHGLFARTTYLLTSNCSLFAGANLSRTKTDTGLTYDRLTPSAGVEYQFANGSFITAEGGASYFLSGSGAARMTPYWAINVTHPFKSFTATVGSSVMYNTDPGRAATEQTSINGRLVKNFERGNAAVYARYSNFTDGLTGDSYGGGLAVGGKCVYDLTPRTTGSLEVSAQKYTGSTLYSDSLNYRLVFEAGVTYEFAHDMSVSLNCIHASDRNSMWSPSASADTNRALLTFRKQFQGINIHTW